MNNILKTCLIASLWFAGAAASFAQTPQAKPTADDQIKADVALAPCKNEDRLATVEKLFRAGGAVDADIATQRFGKIQNLVVTKKGKSEDIVIVSAHYDKVSEGCGAIDNWTGIVVIANLYRTMRGLSTEKTYLFVAFDKEELGLWGSEAMAKAIPKDRRLGYCANLNFDSFGFGYPQVIDNASSSRMIDMVESVADEVKMQFAHAPIAGADADSSSFMHRDIPAVTLHGLNSKWQKYLHSSNDVVSNINMDSVLVGYRFGLRVVGRVDASSCSAFRK
jgi:Zn-dependent M28 family amino/carboxypeptidase